MDAPLINDGKCDGKWSGSKSCPFKPLMVILAIILLVLISILGVGIAILTKLNTNNTTKRDPRIGMAGMRLNETDIGSFNDTIYNFANIFYTDAVQKTGIAPIVLPVLSKFSIDLIEKQLDTIDGLIIPGGYDIVPTLYGEEWTDWIGRTSYLTDVYLIQLIKSAYARKMPILGICRGMQIINVAFGGTLYQDISLTPMKLESRSHYQTADGCVVNHSIIIEPNTMLAEIFPGVKQMEVNSFHHQAVDRIADDFVINAKSTDGLIESMHKKTGFVFATQFHPEKHVACDNKFLPIFQRLVDEAKKYMNSQKK